MRTSLALHPMFLVALGVLLLNDHLLKALWPGLVTGKLSDVAGLVMAPVLLIGTYEFVTGRRMSARFAFAISILVGCVFAAVQILPEAAEAYRLSMGFLQAPFSGPHVSRGVLHIADPWDLLALPAVLVAPNLVRGRSHPHEFRFSVRERLRRGSSPATPRTRTSCRGTR